MGTGYPIVPANGRSRLSVRAVRIVVLATLFVAALLLPAAAFAHGGAEHGGIVSSVDRIEPELGLEASANGDGHFTLTVPEGATVVVRGTGEEPDRRFADGVVAERTPTGWRRIATGTTATWHDHRTHWEGAPPEITEREPKARHELASWRIPGTVDGKPFAIHGSIAWEPKASGPGYEWISYLALGGAALYVAYVLVARRRARS
jgi:hypothetical protein